MYHNIHSGRLRDLVEICTPNITPDEFGQTSGRTVLFDAFAEVKTVSGNKIQEYGTALTSTIITVMMWFDERAATDQVLVFNGVEYEINHINPDAIRKAMILTCEVNKK